MAKMHHLCQSVEGALRLSPEEFAMQFQGVFSDDTGRVLSLTEAHAALEAERAMGHRVIPCGHCDNFDFQTGCQGHEVLDEVRRWPGRPAQATQGA